VSQIYVADVITSSESSLSGRDEGVQRYVLRARAQGPVWQRSVIPSTVDIVSVQGKNSYS
jgi:hypothetical protein